MFRIATMFALVSLLIAGAAGGAAAEARSPFQRTALVSSTDRPAESSGVPPVTFEEIVEQPPAANGYSFVAIAVGAVVGVMAADIVLPVLGYSAVPAALSGTPVTGAMLETALAGSRLITVGAAVAGGAIGQWVYSSWGR